ncbi:MAG: aldo/keto reductase [Methylobacteriaceae bacterium]|nr:aldo/keto reductase [Methylobacteriaceae bacterium]
MQAVELQGGERVPALGQGTWRMGEDRSARASEIGAIRLGIDLGMTLIDTAEMYGEGKTEEPVGEAIARERDRVFLVSKVYPHNASREGVIAACERSLRRLRTDRVDLYLLHWRGALRLAETVRGFDALRRAGKIRHWGVSNFDTSDVAELMSVDGGGACAVNQILYNVARRGPEWDLMPLLAERHIPVMAYSPIEQGRLPGSRALARIARDHGATHFQIALAWLLGRRGVIAIPKAASATHVRENRQAADLRLAIADLEAIDAQFPAPSRRIPLQMI